MVAQTLLDFNRRDQNFTESKVTDILPEYFTSDYPSLVSFLEYYYDFQDSDAAHGFDNKIQNLYKIRDLRATDLDLINQIFKEIGKGKVNSSYFTDPRYVAGLFANYYRIKGSLYSAEGFFRAFFQQQPEIVYPKNNMFIVGGSKIGAESLKYIQNDKAYQVLSVLVRSSVPISEWRTLYKAFVHPAGFHLSGEVVIESLSNLNLGLMPLSIADSDAGVFSVDGFASIFPTGFASLTGIFPDGGDADTQPERLDLNQNITAMSGITIEQLNTMYNDIEDVSDANSPTFDEDSDGAITGIKFSNTLETMDQTVVDGFYGTQFMETGSLAYLFDNTLVTVDGIIKTMDFDSSGS